MYFFILIVCVNTSTSMINTNLFSISAQQLDASDLRHLQRQGGSAVFERPVSGECLFDHVVLFEG